MRKAITSVAGGKILLAKTIRFFHEKIQLFDRNFTLAAGGEPSTRFPPGGLVETGKIPDHSELPRSFFRISALLDSRACSSYLHAPMLAQHGGGTVP